MPLAEGGLPGLCFSALGAVVEGGPPLHNFWALRPMAEGGPSEREAPDILSECHPLAAALIVSLSIFKEVQSNYLNLFSVCLCIRILGIVRLPNLEI